MFYNILLLIIKKTEEYKYKTCKIQNKVPVYEFYLIKCDPKPLTLVPFFLRTELTLIKNIINSFISYQTAVPLKKNLGTTCSRDR